MPRIIDLQKTRYDWVETIADISAPTTTELAAGQNISPFVVATTAVRPVASETVSQRAITDGANVYARTIGNYEGNLVLFRDGPGDGTVQFSATDPSTIFTGPDLFGYVVKRIGLPWDDAHAAAQVVQVYYFATDVPVEDGGTDAGFLQMTVPLLAQGRFDVRASVAAGV